MTRFITVFPVSNEDTLPARFSSSPRVAEEMRSSFTIYVIEPLRARARARTPNR